MKPFVFSLCIFFSGCVSAISPAFEEILELFGVEEARVEELWMQKGKERWEFDKRYEYMRPTAWPYFEIAGLVFEAFPQSREYDYAIVFGALLATVEKRIAFLERLRERGVNFNEIVFLTGDRDLLLSERERSGCRIESEMVEWAYRQSDLSKDIPATFVFAPKQSESGFLRCPRTHDTVEAWLRLSPTPGRCLAVSNQPYVGYQHAVLNSLLPRGFSLETVGPGIQGEPTVALMLDTIAKQIIAERSR